MSGKVNKIGKEALGKHFPLSLYWDWKPIVALLERKRNRDEVWFPLESLRSEISDAWERLCGPLIRQAYSKGEMAPGRDGVQKKTVQSYLSTAESIIFQWLWEPLSPMCTCSHHSKHLFHGELQTKVSFALAKAGDDHCVVWSFISWARRKECAVATLTCRDPAPLNHNALTWPL